MNIDDSKRMQDLTKAAREDNLVMKRLTEAAAGDSAAMKQIAFVPGSVFVFKYIILRWPFDRYLTMMFLPATFVAQYYRS